MKRRKKGQTKGSNQPILKCRHLIFKSLKISRSVFFKKKKKEILFPAAATVYLKIKLG